MTHVSASPPLDSDNLDSVVSYCQNKQVCRRVQQLAYFGEHVSDSVCNNKCDVCVAGIVYDAKDFTKEARLVVDAVEVRCLCLPLIDGLHFRLRLRTLLLCRSMHGKRAHRIPFSRLPSLAPWQCRRHSHWACRHSQRRVVKKDATV